MQKYDFKTYDEVYEFIQSQKQRVYALDHFKAFMEAQNNPQKKLKTIHIGGTNGKGSTTNYIREVLQCAYHKVATFTSPALISRLDIIRINDCPIPEEKMLYYANKYMDICLQYELSMFEIEVFIAIMYFVDENVDYAIFEVGLGGELDATNIIHPMVCVNTNIGLDHINYLGDSYEKIARTKAGIVKEGIAYIVGEKRKECLDVFKEICLKHHSPLIQLDEIENIKEDLMSVSFLYKDYQIELSTPARYQCYNASLAIEVLLYLNQNQLISINDEMIKDGLKKAKWLGRFEIIHENPLIIIDGAHNKEGIDAFIQSAKKFNHRKIIFSALRDKDTHGMIEKLLTVSKDITITEFEHVRSSKAEILAEDFPVKIEKDWHKAIDECFQYDGTIFITGSLYFLSEVRKYLLKE